MAVLDVQNLTLSFGERTLFAGVSFSIKEREKVGFVGANGVGKTSLFKVICGDYTPDSGGAFLSKNCKLGYMEQHTCSAGWRAGSCRRCRISVRSPSAVSPLSFS